MNTFADRKSVLLDMKADILKRVQNAQADLDAIDRLLDCVDAINPFAVVSSVKEIRNAAIDVLARHGKPIHRKIISDELASMGVYVSGKDPIANLGAILSRHAEDFAPHSQGIWGLKAPPVSSNNGHRDVQEEGDVAW